MYILFLKYCSFDSSRSPRGHFGPPQIILGPQQNYVLQFWETCTQKLLRFLLENPPHRSHFGTLLGLGGCPGRSLRPPGKGNPKILKNNDFGIRLCIDFRSIFDTFLLYVCFDFGYSFWRGSRRSRTRFWSLLRGSWATFSTYVHTPVISLFCQPLSR